MRAVILLDGTLEIRPGTPAEDYTLRKWYEDWQAHKVCLRVSFIDQAKTAESGERSYTSREMRADE